VRDELDDLLERWAARSRLGETEASAILAAVLEAPQPALDPAWWQGLMGRVSGLVVQVTTMPEAARAAMVLPAPVLALPR
jgi:hypothetical protein